MVGRRIEALVQKLRFCIGQCDQQAIDAISLEVSNEVYEVNRQAYLYAVGDDDDAAASAAIVRR